MRVKLWPGLKAAAIRSLPRCLWSGTRLNLHLLRELHFRYIVQASLNIAEGRWDIMLKSTPQDQSTLCTGLWGWPPFLDHVVCSNSCRHTHGPSRMGYVFSYTFQGMFELNFLSCNQSLGFYTVYRIHEIGRFHKHDIEICKPSREFALLTLQIYTQAAISGCSGATSPNLHVIPLTVSNSLVSWF